MYFSWSCLPFFLSSFLVFQVELQILHWRVTVEFFGKYIPAFQFPKTLYLITEVTLKMVYYYKPDLLSDSNTSNLFLANCPDLLLYGALAEAVPYLMNDERLATWSALYDRGLASLRASDDDGEYPSSPMSITLSTR